MAARNWNRPDLGQTYGIGGYMGSHSANIMNNMGFYVCNPMDRRTAYNTSPMLKPYGGGYRDEPLRRPRDEYRGAKKPKARSPIGDKRTHHDAFSSRKDNRSGKRQQSSGRYEIKVPKMPFNMKSGTLPEIKMMHPRITVPSDVSKACYSWQDSFPLHEPMKIATKTDIYILHRDVESNVVHQPNALHAPDADYAYSVRVMLMASPELGELYKNTCRTADEPNSSEKTAASKNIYFLVGGRTKTETMGIGGPWSPSLDGENPESDPQALINTAIRTFKGFTGIDLSSVTEWTRMLEIRYYRCANTKAPTLTEDEEEREITEDKQEVVVFLMPNVAHLVPTDSEWEKTKQIYSDAMQKILSPVVTKTETPGKDESVKDASQIMDTTLNESQEVNEVNTSDLTPNSMSKQYVNNMKVTELKSELTARGLDTKGMKANLVARLQSALDSEKEGESGEVKTTDNSKSTEETAKPAAASSQPKEESKEITEKDRRRLERLYRLGDKPAILVYPNRTARGNRFDCHRVSLYSLLDYRSEEQKEHNFEVSLFAEQFHEMLQRDCAFNIFKAIYTAPEKESKDTKSINGESPMVSKEPETKRRRNESGEGGLNDDETEVTKVRRLRRTVDVQLLFSFIYFDTGHSGFIRDYDLIDILHLLNLGYSKAQMKKLIAKVTTRRDHVQYRNLTDKDVSEGDSNDVVSLNLEPKDPEFLRDLAAGNDILFGGEKPQTPPKIFIGSGNDEELLQRTVDAETKKKSMEFQFFQIKDELEKTRGRLNACKDTEEKLRNDNRDYQNKFKDEQKCSRDNKILVSTYTHMLKHCRDSMSNVVNEIEKQFEKEKLKKESEKAAAEEEKAKIEAEKLKLEKSEEAEKGKNGEKEWEVVDQV